MKSVKGKLESLQDTKMRLGRPGCNKANTKQHHLKKFQKECKGKIRAGHLRDYFV